MSGWWGINPPRGDWDRWIWRTVTTTTTKPIQPATDEEQVRKIVREELADVLPVDVPDEPPEEW